MPRSVNKHEVVSLSVSGTDVITSDRQLKNVAIDATLITTGALNAARIPGLDASKVTTGRFVQARMPTGTGFLKASGGDPSYVALTAADIPNLDAGKITTGAFNAARIPSLSPSKITQDAIHRFVTDSEKLAWNGKQDALSGDVVGHYHAADRKLSDLVPDADKDMGGVRLRNFIWRAISPAAMKPPNEYNSPSGNIFFENFDRDIINPDFAYAVNPTITIGDGPTGTGYRRQIAFSSDQMYFRYGHTNHTEWIFPWKKFMFTDMNGVGSLSGLVIKDGGTVDGVDISTHNHDGTAIGGKKISSVDDLTFTGHLLKDSALQLLTTSRGPQLLYAKGIKVGESYTGISTTPGVIEADQYRSSGGYVLNDGNKLTPPGGLETNGPVIGASVSASGAINSLKSIIDNKFSIEYNTTENSLDFIYI